jgi:superfamily II DNA or RNA helicase
MASLINLPDLFFEPSKYSVGQCLQLLATGGNTIVNKIEKVNITKLTTADCYHLKSGEKILLTTKARLLMPSDIDGVLRLHSDGTYSWIAHRKLTEAHQKYKALGAKGYAMSLATEWPKFFQYRAQLFDKDGKPDSNEPGLRPPQLGALFSIASHWSLYSQSGTIVMPTGTGKTETMLSVLASQRKLPIIVGVPSKALRKQTARKFLTFGLLRKLKLLPADIPNPMVGILEHQPKNEDDLRIFEECNVIISVVASLTGGTAMAFAKKMADRCAVLIVDEAHHIAAATWSEFKEAFSGKLVLQFTATPFRADGKLVEGEVLFNYPLKQAQDDGYFKKIQFVSVYELTTEAADEAIAIEACKKLREDLAIPYQHLMMVRCASINRATTVLKFYEKHGKEFSPLLIHSEQKDNVERIEKLVAGVSKIAVCVNMLGEGFDLPALKIAAVHDTQKSLGPLLQFAGRFTRSSGDQLGDATVIANIADDHVFEALNRLYSEDSDWNTLLSELSSNAAKEHARLVEFLKNSISLGEDTDDVSGISKQLLTPTLSTLAFECSSFSPKKFHEAIPSGLNIAKVWLNDETNTLFFVTKSVLRIKWTRSKGISDTQWDLFVLHYDSKLNLLYVASSDKSSNYESLAKAVGGGNQLSGEMIFRSLGRINRLVFTNLGVSKHGRKNLSYAMYTGSDVRQALTQSEKAGSRKANINGFGWEGGKQVTIGCSYKGRVWARDVGSIPEFIDWAEAIGQKLLDSTINTKDIIDNVLIPDELTALPNIKVLGIEWPVELLRQSEDRVLIKKGANEIPMLLCDIKFKSSDLTSNKVLFSIIGPDDDTIGEFILTLTAASGFTVDQIDPSQLIIKIGVKEDALEQYFSRYPPLIRFVDLTEMDGNLILRPQNPYTLELPEYCLEAWDWAGVDITKESIWKDANERKDSIQWAVAQRFIGEDFDIVFDDDGPNEAADIIAIKEESLHIRLVLIHCKYSGSSGAGERLNDVIVVASQATRSAKWAGRFRELCKHIVSSPENRTV